MAPLNHPKESHDYFLTHATVSAPKSCLHSEHTGNSNSVHFTVSRRQKCLDVIEDVKSLLGVKVELFSATVKQSGGRRELQLPSANVCPSSFALPLAYPDLVVRKKWRKPQVTRKNRLMKLVKLRIPSFKFDVWRHLKFSCFKK